jgi:hypothetical protein
MLRLDIRKNKPLLAFGRFISSDVTKAKDLKVNIGYRWKTDDITETDSSVEITFWRTGRYTKSTNNITLRRLQKFKIKAGQTYSWAVKSLDGKTVIGQGTAQADNKGVLTLKSVKIPSSPSRLVVGK